MINYIENRNKIFDVIEDNSIVILHSGYDQHKSADAFGNSSQQQDDRLEKSDCLYHQR